MIPKHFSFVCFVSSHKYTHGETHEKIAFDSKDPFLMMMEAKRNERRQKNTERFFRIYRHNWMLPESDSRERNLSCSSKRRSVFLYVSILSHRLELKASRRLRVNKKNYSRASQFVSYAPSRRLLPSVLCSAFFNSPLQFIPSSPSHFFSSLILVCCAYQKTIFSSSFFSFFSSVFSLTKGPGSKKRSEIHYVVFLCLFFSACLASLGALIFLLEKSKNKEKKEGKKPKSWVWPSNKRKKMNSDMTLNKMPAPSSESTCCEIVCGTFSCRYRDTGRGGNKLKRRGVIGVEGKSWNHDIKTWSVEFALREFEFFHHAAVDGWMGTV